MVWRVEFLPAAYTVCDIQDRAQTVLVVAIGDRREVYR